MKLNLLSSKQNFVLSSAFFFIWLEIMGKIVEEKYDNELKYCPKLLREISQPYFFLKSIIDNYEWFLFAKF